MSATETDVVVTTKTAKRPPVWHSPADSEQRANAQAGRPWIARCGKRVKRTTPGTEPRKVWQLAPMEPCVVCVDLGIQANRARWSA